MRWIRRAYVAFVVGLGLGLVLLVATRPAAGQRDYLVVGLGQEPRTLFLQMDSMAAMSEIMGLLHVPLVTLGDRWDLGELRPVACLVVPTLDNGLWRLERNAAGAVERMVVTWKLRPDVRWSDGTPLTAEDYRFAQEVITHDRVEVVSRTVESMVDRMEAPDPYTLVVHWKQPYAYANCFDLAAHLAMPRHVLEPAFRRDPAALASHVQSTRPIGNGPYTLLEWRAGQLLRFGRNPHYFGPRPQLARIDYRIVPKSQTMVSELESETIDAISPVGASFDEVVALGGRAQRRERSLVASIRPGIIWEHIDLNLDDPMLADVRVRRALLHAIDRETLVQQLFSGHQPVAHSWLPPQHEAFAENARRYAYDPAAAERLLEEAGWRRPAPGAVRTRDGARLELEFMTTKDNALRERVQQILGAQWRAVGIEVHINNQPANVYFGTTTRQRKFKHLAMYAWVLDPTAHGQDLWSSDAIPTRENGWIGKNVPGLRHPEIDALHRQIPATMDRAARIALLHRQQALWLEALPVLPLYFRASVSAHRRALEEWRPTGHSDPVTWNSGRWSLGAR